jgi:hypothetical protein
MNLKNKLNNIPNYLDYLYIDEIIECLSTSLRYNKDTINS